MISIAQLPGAPAALRLREIVSPKRQINPQNKLTVK